MFDIIYTRDGQTRYRGFAHTTGRLSTAAYLVFIDVFKDSIKDKAPRSKAVHAYLLRPWQQANSHSRWHIYGVKHKLTAVLQNSPCKRFKQQFEPGLSDIGQYIPWHHKNWSIITDFCLTGYTAASIPVIHLFNILVNERNQWEELFNDYIGFLAMWLYGWRLCSVFGW